jgi:error-prone DNA polymerase
LYETRLLYQTTTSLVHRGQAVQEAQKLGVPVLPALLEISDVRFKLEHQKGGLAIRLPLSGIDGISQDVARIIVLERAQKPFASLEDFVTRTMLPKDILKQLAKANALRCFGARRDMLWLQGILEGRRQVTDGLQARLSAVNSENRV